MPFTQTQTSHQVPLCGGYFLVHNNGGLDKWGRTIMGIMLIRSTTTYPSYQHYHGIKWPYQHYHLPALPLLPTLPTLPALPPEWHLISITNQHYHLISITTLSALPPYQHYHSYPPYQHYHSYPPYQHYHSISITTLLTLSALLLPTLSALPLISITPPYQHYHYYIISKYHSKLQPFHWKGVTATHLVRGRRKWITSHLTLLNRVLSDQKQELLLPTSLHRTPLIHKYLGYSWFWGFRSIFVNFSLQEFFHAC